MFKSISISFVFSMVLFSAVHGQLDMAIGDWVSHLPHIRGLGLAQSGDYIIYSTDFSLVLISKEDNSVHFVSKIDGLSDTGIDNIYFDQFNKHLVIIYSNSNIDFYTRDGVINIPDILNSTSIIGSKKIFDVHFMNENQMFLATAFGIVEYRTRRKEFGSTIFTDLRVNSISSKNSILFAGTDDGLYSIKISGGVNIADFRAWNLLGPDQNLPLLYEVRDLTQYKDHIYFTDGLTIYESQDGEYFLPIYNETDNRYMVNYISGGKSFLMAGSISTNDSKIMYWNKDVGWIEGSNSCIDRIRYSIEDESGNIWFADDFRNFRVIKGPYGHCLRMLFNSPYTEKVSDIDIYNGLLATASGGVSDNYLDLFNRDGFSLLQGKTWKNYNEQNYLPIRDNDLLSFFKVLFTPDGKKLNVATFWGGLFEFGIDDESYTLYNQHNSSLQLATGDVRVRVSDMVYDESGNLWITNFNAVQPVVVKTNENQWHSLSVPGERRLGDIEIDQNNNKWIVTLGAARGILVFNEGSSLSTPANFKYRSINQNNSNLPSSTVYTVKKDLLGSIWAGTSEGAVVFECFDPFDDSCTGNRRPVEVDGEIGFLLESEEVRVIEVDGANQKWFGTRNGIFVMNANGEEQIAHFNTRNSPLFDNVIVSLGYDGQSGIMYISTDKGLQAIRTISTAGNRRHNNVFAFPNPVPPDYNGPIAIKGLANNALVKITDVSGRLIYETRAAGGQAIWNGEGLSGKMARPGVFLVFSTGTISFDETDSYVTKIMFSGR